jgi:hypothetical protein
MEELYKIYKEAGQEFVNDLLHDYVIVTEKLSGSSFAFEQHGDAMVFFKGTSHKPINLVDRTMMMYYEPAIAHIERRIRPIKTAIPEGWRFCFQYFVHNEPGVIKYSILPKNNLVLTHIHVKGENGKTAKIIDDPRVIRDWAAKMDVTPLQPFFAGHLTTEQQDKIREFISIPTEDQEELFGTKSFASYVLQVLNPDVTMTTLHGDLVNPIDSLVFKFIKAGSGKTMSAKIIDPYTKTLMKIKQPVDIRRAPADMNEIILLDLLAFIEERGIKKSDVLAAEPDARYIELVSTLFNEYVDQNLDSLKGVSFDNADFSAAPEFGINLDMITNKKTKTFIQDYPNLGDLYKVMLGSLRKRRDPLKAGSVMTPSVIEDFNKLVDKISGIIQREEGGEFKTFEDYLKLKTVNESIVDAIEVIQEERVLNYRQFMNLGRISIPGPIVEALTVPHKEQGKQKVNMIVGRFQPFTLGHAKVFEQIHKQNGLPVVVFTVRGKKPDPDKSPFSEELQQAMFAKMQREYPFLEAMYVAPSAAVDTLYSMLRPAYEPVLWGYGTDRKKQYDFMINKPEYREQLGVDPSFSGYEIKRADEDVSASQVREAIMLDDKKTFERMTPRSIHDMWETLQDVLVPVTESTQFKSSMNARQRDWATAFDNYAGPGKWGTPSTERGRSAELLRVTIGKNDGSAEKEVVQFLNTVGFNSNDYTIEMIPPGSIVPETSTTVSGEYASYKISVIRPFKDSFDQPYKKGDFIFITNRTKERGGYASVINRKDLTPDAMNLVSADYHTAQSLASAVEASLAKMSFPDNYKEFIRESYKSIMDDTNNSSKFHDMETYVNGRNTRIDYRIDPAVLKGIDSISIDNFRNDFGEVLGGFMFFNILKTTGSGLRYPTASNAALIDFIFDDYKISSKGGGGSAPSGDTMIKIINEQHKSGEINFDTIEEQDFYQNVITQWINPPKLDQRSAIYNIVMNLANVNLIGESSYKYLLSNASLQPTTATRESIVAYLDDISQDESKFALFMKGFFDRSSFDMKRKNIETIRLDYLNSMKTNNSNRIGIVFYPIMVDVANGLNSQYQSILTKYAQIATSIKQVYLKISIKDSLYTFITQPFGTANFAFEQKGSMTNPFNANLGIVVKK